MTWMRYFIALAVLNGLAVLALLATGAWWDAFSAAGTTRLLALCAGYEYVVAALRDRIRSLEAVS